MRRAVYSFTFVIFVLTVLVQGCDVVGEYDVVVFNDTDFDFSVYMDDVLQFRLAPGGNSTIRDVEEGIHTLDARVSGDIIAEKTIDVDADMEWIVYVATYDVTIINSTRSYFSVYLDGLFQFDLNPGDIGTITDVSEGTHTIDARVGDFVIADETFLVDQDTEWEIYD